MYFQMKSKLLRLKKTKTRHFWNCIKTFNYLLYNKTINLVIKLVSESILVCRVFFTCA